MKLQWRLWGVWGYVLPGAALSGHQIGKGTALVNVWWFLIRVSFICVQKIWKNSAQYTYFCFAYSENPRLLEFDWRPRLWPCRYLRICLPVLLSLSVWVSQILAHKHAKKIEEKKYHVLVCRLGDVFWILREHTCWTTGARIICTRSPARWLLFFSSSGDQIRCFDSPVEVTGRWLVLMSVSEAVSLRTGSEGWWGGVCCPWAQTTWGQCSAADS